MVDASDDCDPRGLVIDTGRAHQRRGAWAPGWIPYAYLAFAAALVPWAIYLAVILPRRYVSEHYRATWVGFDIALIPFLIRIGWFAHRRNPRVVLTAAAGATMLVADAWFDITTAAMGACLDAGESCRSRSSLFLTRLAQHELVSSCRNWAAF